MFTRQLPPYLMLNGPEDEPGTPAGPTVIRSSETLNTPVPTPEPVPQPDSAPAAAPMSTPAQPAADTPPWGDDFDPEKAWRLVQALRGDVAKIKEKRDADIDAARTEAEKKAIEKAYADMGKTLGVVPEDDGAPTPESLAESLREKDSSLTAAQAALQATRAENAVLRYAGKHGGDADALLDSRDFERKLSGIDHNAEDYASQVEALVQAEVEKNSRYRKAQVAPSNTNGGTPPGGGNPAAAQSVDELREAHRKSRTH